MKITDSSVKLFFLVFLSFSLITLFPVLSLAGDSATITVTIKIEPFQQLKLETNHSLVDVTEEGGNPVSKIELNKVDSNEITLESALKATVKSNVDWKLLAHTENDYVIKNGDRTFSSGPSLSLQLSALPNGVQSAYSGNWLDVDGGSKGVATGQPGTRGPLDISYKLEFNNHSVAELTGAGVDVVYTMMKL